MGRNVARLRHRKKGRSNAALGGTTTTREAEGFKNDGVNNSLDNEPSFVNGDLGRETAHVVGDLPEQRNICSSSTVIFDYVNGGHQTEQPVDSDNNVRRHHSSHSPESIVRTSSSEAWTHDDAVVTMHNVHQAIERVTALKDDARIMAAAKLARKVESFLKNTMDTSTKKPGLDASALHSSHRDTFSNLYIEDREYSSILEEDTSDDWKYSHTFRGIMTHFKIENNMLWLKLHGNMEGALLFDQLVTMREADLYHKWFPMCSQSKTVKKIGKSELIMHFTISLPGFSRDAVLYASACDATIERNCVLVKGQPVDKYESAEIPPEPNSLFSKRMVIHAFNSVFEFVGPTSVRTSLVMCADPKAPLPRNMTHLVVRKIGGIILHRMAEAACGISTDPHSHHRYYVRQDEEFYKDWIIPKIETIYAIRGWEYQSPEYLLDNEDDNGDVSNSEEASKVGPVEESSTAVLNSEQPHTGDITISTTTTARAAKKGWRKRFKRKMSVIAKKVGMRRKSREEDSSSSSHLIKEDGSLMDPTHDDPVCNVPLPEQKLEKTMTVGSFRASDLVRIKYDDKRIGICISVAICTVPLFYQWHTFSTESKWKPIPTAIIEGILRLGIAQFFWQMLASSAWTVTQSPSHWKQKHTRAFIMHYIRFADVGWSVLVWFVSLLAHGFLCIVLGVDLCTPSDWLLFPSRVDATLLMTSSIIILFLGAFQLTTTQEVIEEDFL